MSDINSYIRNTLDRADTLDGLGRHEGAKRMREDASQFESVRAGRRAAEISALNTVVQALTDAKRNAGRTSDKYFDGMLIAAVEFDAKFHTKIEENANV